MICSACNYRKDIALYSKCAGVAGRMRVGTAYYCAHPDMTDPVPVIPYNGNIHSECPVTHPSELTIPENT